VFRPRLVPGAVPCPRAIAYQRISARREGPIGMGLVIGTLVVGVAAGLVLGGRVGNLGDLRIRWLPLALAGFALQSISISDSVWPLVILAVSYALLTAFAVENVRARTPGARLILIGILLNFTVIALNGGMPVTRSALVASGEQNTLHELVDGHAVKHHLASADDSLVILGDVIPLARVRAALEGRFRPLAEIPTPYHALEAGRAELASDERREIAAGRLLPAGSRLVYERDVR